MAFLIIIALPSFSDAKFDFYTHAKHIQNSPAKNSYMFTHIIQAPKTSPKELFDFFEHLDQNYLKLSPSHQSFDIQNVSKLEKNAIIDNTESAGGQHITHRYRVVDFIPNEYIKMVSEKSLVRGKAGFIPYKMRVKTIVEFEIVSENKHDSLVLSKLIITFPSKSKMVFANLGGTKKIWQAHFNEEMSNGNKLFRTKANANY